MAEEIGYGDAVFTTNFSYFATTEVISLCHATPIFIDIDENSFNIDPNLLEQEITKVIEEGKLTPKAIISVDLFGQLANYEKIEKIAKKYKLLLIEDAAQSFGATLNNKKSCSFGDVAATSFYPAKPLGCYGDGGAIFTNDIKKADIYRSIRVHGQGKDKYDNVRIGLNSRLDTIQATILLNKLNIFDQELKRRNKIAKFYSQNIIEYVSIPFIEKNNISSWAQYSILVKSKEHRDKLVKHLNKKNIPIAIFYKKIFSKNSIYDQYCNKLFPISEDISNRILSIPMHPYLKNNELNYITDNIKKYFNNK